MKNTLYTRMDQLITLSRQMLEELENGNPSLEYIESMLHQKSSLINELSPIIYQFRTTGVTFADHKFLTERFQAYRLLHDKTECILHKIFNHQKVLLGNASKKRKAEEQYQVMEPPDISYFTDQ